VRKIRHRPISILRTFRKNSKQMMQAIRVKQFGAPDVLQVETVPIPQPGPGKVLIKVMSTGVNPVETYKRGGNHSAMETLPYTPGGDGAGIVEQVGTGVTSVKIGDRVWLINGEGTYAQYCLVSEAGAQPLPDHLNFDQGASLWVPYATAYYAIFHVGRVQKASKLMIHGASGGVGQACLQLARKIPGRPLIIGTAGSAEGLKSVESEGAIALSHKEEGYMKKVMEHTNGQGLNVILEMLANVNLGHDLKVLAKGGNVVVIGSRGPVEIVPRELMMRGASITGLMLNNATPEQWKEIVHGINQGIRDKSLTPKVGRSYKLSETPQAHHDIINPPVGALGKIVIHPWD